MTPLLQALEGHPAGVALGNAGGGWAVDRKGKKEAQESAPRWTRGSYIHRKGKMTGPLLVHFPLPGIVLRWYENDGDTKANRVVSSGLGL